MFWLAPSKLPSRGASKRSTTAHTCTSANVNVDQFTAWVTAALGAARVPSLRDITNPGSQARNGEEQSVIRWSLCSFDDPPNGPGRVYRMGCYFYTASLLHGRYLWFARFMERLLSPKLDGLLWLRAAKDGPGILLEKRIILVNERNPARMNLVWMLLCPIILQALVFVFHSSMQKDKLESWKDTVQPVIMFVHCTIETILQKAAEKRNQFVPIGTLETVHDCIILILLSDVSSDGRLIFWYLLEQKARAEEMKWRETS